jgi:uncharacterized protein with PIN domain
MVIDTSALLAVLLNEPDAETYRIAIEEHPTRLIAAGTRPARPPRRVDGRAE